MSETVTSKGKVLDQLQEFCEKTKTWGVVGSLIGKTLSDRNVVLEKEWAKFNAASEAALAKAKETGQPVEVDGAGVSLNNGGDTWIFNPDGKMERKFSLYPDFEKILPLIEQETELDETRELPREEVFMAAFNALWGPSATNWQPVIVLEVTPSLQDVFIQHFKLKTKAHPNLPLLLLMRREHYDSLLGDVMEAFGFAVTAKEESIDVGIYEEILKMSFSSRGLGYHSGDVDDSMMEGAVRLVEDDLLIKLDALKEMDGSSKLVTDEIKKLETTLDFLKRGKYFPDVLFQVGYPKKETGVVFPQFDQLTLERSTQRVASPVGEVSEEEINKIIDNCMSALPPEEREVVHLSSFTWHDKTVIDIGSGMFEALYGKGADPETKKGGEQGFLSGMTVRNYITCLKNHDPEILPFFSLEQLKNMPEADLKPLARETHLKARHIGPYLLERMTLDGKYIVDEEGEIISERGKPVSVALMVKLLSGIASTFGNFFLKFKNTHPITLMILGKEEQTLQTLNKNFKAVGKIGALLSYEVRRLGYTAITKTGPIDLAMEQIREILAKHHDKNPDEKIIAERLRSKEWSPAMVFQFGYPLAGSDIIDKGTSEEHSGLEERKRDKRPTRYGLDARYIVSH